MDLQTTVVAFVVGASALYALWSLMPAAARRGLARAALRWPLPGAWRSRLRRTAQAGGGCGCSGCDAAPPAAVPREQTVQLHRAPPGRRR